MHTLPLQHVSRKPQIRRYGSRRLSSAMRKDEGDAEDGAIPCRVPWSGARPGWATVGMRCCRTMSVSEQWARFRFLLSRGYDVELYDLPSRSVASSGLRVVRVATGFIALLVVLWFGACLATVSPLPLPAPLIGMVLLAALLAMYRGPAARAASAAGDMLLRRYALFFVPAGVGVITQMSMLRGAWVAIVASLFISSLLALAVTGLTMRLLLACGRGDPAVHDGDRSP